MSSAIQLTCELLQAFRVCEPRSSLDPKSVSLCIVICQLLAFRYEQARLLLGYRQCILIAAFHLLLHTLRLLVCLGPYTALLLLHCSLLDFLLLPLPFYQYRQEMPQIEFGPQTLEEHNGCVLVTLP